MTISNPNIAYKVGFSSAFFKSSEISERAKYTFAGAVRYIEESLREFHRGYFECNQLIQRISVEKSIIEEKREISVSADFSNSSNDVFEIMNNLLNLTDLIKMKEILSSLGYNGLDY
jgi:hypothetical protein